MSASQQYRLYKSIDQEAVQGLKPKKLETLIAQANIILDFQFQDDAPPEVVNLRTQQYHNLVGVSCRKLQGQPDTWSAQLTNKYRLVYGWRTPSANATQTKHPVTGKIMKAAFRASDDQNDSL
eukprot:gnl/Hemi2/17176_TR5719_c0_g4_i1.p1 gnl/Hemi2/17176_TR5719_c0_g4~~gnl/Hemi2/17176_TR5719_c0_g4_i1.p1  ORF type:complete len:123 (-),score=5.43 gnl/Hemi2/17176_TR5719_c0_g4_i1:46-414(-)